MSISVVKTKEALENPQVWGKLTQRHFPDEYTAQGHDYSHWLNSPFYFSNYTTNEDGKAVTFASFMFTCEQTYLDLLAGKIKEHEMMPFKPGCMEKPYLYWPTLIVEQRQHTPYLFKSIFKEIDRVCQEWELEVSHVYNIAFSKASIRLLKRYHFTEEGLYENEFPIMISEVNKNPPLYAMLPYKVL